MTMDGPKLSGKEAALVDAARRELAARASREPTGGSTGGSTPVSAPVGTPSAPVRADAAERVVALLMTEREETLRRKKKLRQYGIVIPAVILVAALLWVGAAIWRYARI